MKIECPYCKKEQEISIEELADNSCDDAEYECIYCRNMFNVGWYAVAEVRGDK